MLVGGYRTMPAEAVRTIEAHPVPRVPPVLVVDDDPAAVDLITRFLAAMRLVNPIVPVEQGDTAIRVLEAANPGPALVLLDVHMPGTSGLDVLRWMRTRARYSDAPVVMLTGSADFDVVNETYELGAVHYLVKPVGFAALGDTVRRLEVPWAVFLPGEVGGR